MRRSFIVSSISFSIVRDFLKYFNLRARLGLTHTAIGFGALLLISCFSTEVFSQEAEPIEMSIVAVNPSAVKEQIVEIKSYLPKEITPDMILDTSGLDVEFDSQQSMYYVYKKEVTLRPAETKVFKVELKDAWIIPQGRLDSLKVQAESVISRLEGSPFYESAQLLGETIFQTLETIAVTQNDQAVSRKSHIGIYRNNLTIIEQIKDDIDRLEKQLVIASALPKPDVLEKSDLKTESPTKSTSWMIIFIIMLFIGMLAGVFFFTWHAQAHATSNLIADARNEAFPDQESSDDETPK